MHSAKDRGKFTRFPSFWASFWPMSLLPAQCPRSAMVDILTPAVLSLQLPPVLDDNQGGSDLFS